MEKKIKVGDGKGLTLFSQYIRKEMLNSEDIFLLSAFSSVPTFIGIFDNNSEVFFHFNRFIWLIVLYCFASYIRFYGMCRERWTIFHWTGIHICTWFILLLFIIFIPENGISEHVKMKNTYFWHPNSIIMVVLSISLFMIFRNIKINENRVISYIASCTFGIYLGHSDRSIMIWNTIFHRDLVGAKAVLIDMMCAFTCIIMTTLLIESVRKQLERPVAWLYDYILRRGKNIRQKI